MNRIRFGVLLIGLSLLVAIVAGVLLGIGRGLLVAGVVGVAAEVMFWGGVLLLGHSTYKVARQEGWSRTPAHLWRMLRTGTAPEPGPSTPVG